MLLTFASDLNLLSRLYIEDRENNMSIIRTPDERFANLPDYDFAPNYIDIDGKRVHYVDEGTGDAPILCLHGEPTWSYLYRHMIPVLAPHVRTIAPDFIGFGRSDKLTNIEDYSFDLHCNTLINFIEKLDLENITLIVHDWGGLVGLPVATRISDRIARLVIFNTFLPNGTEEPTRAFKAWRRMVERSAPDLPIGQVMEQSLLNPTPEVIAAYEAPFPTAEYKAGTVAWPLMVPLTTDDPVASEMQKARDILAKWTKPAQVIFATDDPILGSAAPFFHHLIPTAKEQPEISIDSGGHFLQDAKGTELAQHVLDFIERTPLS